MEVHEPIGREPAASESHLTQAASFDGEPLPELAGFFCCPSEAGRRHPLQAAQSLVEARASVGAPAVEAPRTDVASAKAAVKLAVEWVNGSHRSSTRCWIRPSRTRTGRRPGC